MGNLSALGYLFSQTHYYCYQMNTNSSGISLTNSLVLLSASQPDEPSAPWDVRVAIDMTKPENQTKNFELYECSMDAPSVEWLLAEIIPSAALAGWCVKIQKYIFSRGAILRNPGDVIASSLNNMMTNAGASWNDTAEPIIIEDPTQGCLASQALISWPVLLLFAMVSVSFLGILGYLVFLTVELRYSVRPSLSSSASSTPYSGKNKSEELPPSGYLTWMRRAVQETHQGHKVSLKSLKMWSFGRGPSGDFVIIPSQKGEDFENNEERKRLTSKGSGDLQPREYASRFRVETEYWDLRQ